MGNCDTHLFLGSNSQKTVEYFSKALGEKTISRDSKSVSRDRSNMRTGYSMSDNIMARALLTPDELRRLDNDLCIIYEKGIKPIKAHKYYYFEYPTVKYASKYPENHNDIEAIDRGVWRTYNPYNPYNGEDEEPTANVAVESLDDLFDEPTDAKLEDLEELNINEEPPKQPIKPKKSPKPAQVAVNIDDQFEDIPAPTLPQPEEEEDINNITQDIQKELEDKFDELFGALEDDNNDT